MRGPVSTSRITRVTGQIFRLELGRYQCWAFDGTDGVTLIDAGEPGSGDMIVDLLGEIGRAPEDIVRLVLTHFHDDHAGSAAEIVRLSSAQTIAHELDVADIEGRGTRSEPKFTDWERDLHAVVAAGLKPAPPVGVDRAVRHGDILDLGGSSAIVVATPGHTAGSLGLHLPEEGVLFSGDIAAHHDGALILGVFNTEPGVALESFAALAELDLQLICPGHGDPVVSDIRARIDHAVSSTPK